MAAARDGQPRNRWPLLLGWLGVAFCCALLWGSERLLRYQQRRAEQEAVTRRALFNGLSETLYQSFGKSPQAFEADLNRGQPLQRLPDFGEDVIRARWDASAAGPEYGGWTVQLTFRPDDRGRSGTLVAARTTPPPPRFGDGPSYAALVVMEKTRHAALLAGGGIWFLGLMTLLSALPWRRTVAQVCLAGALLAAVAWAVAPQRGWHRAELLTPLPIAIAAGLLLSVLAWVIPARRRALKSDQAPCAHCGYDLTGNVSGVCPECGRITPRGRVNRWQDLADRIEGRKVESDVFEGTEEPEGLEAPEPLGAPAVENPATG